MKKHHHTWVSLLLWLLCATGQAHAYSDFNDVEYVRCYDGDTCFVNLNIPGLPDIFGKELGVRFAGIDAPEINGNCARENTLAKEARYVFSIERPCCCRWNRSEHALARKRIGQALGGQRA